jgi:ABC-type tungstate transport system permease subunit
MTDELISLIFVSAEKHPMGSRDLEQLFRTSHTNNSRRNVTGALLYADGSFMELLEGEKSVIDKLFRKIEQDARHHFVMLIDRSPLQEREFSSWETVSKDSTVPAWLETVSSIGQPDGQGMQLLRKLWHSYRIF